MEHVNINGKAIYTPKGAALEYGRVGCNFYTGCPHECEYCYLKRGAPSKQLGSTEVKLKKQLVNETKALEIFERELDAHLEYLQKVGIFLSFTTDPLIKETRNMTTAAILRTVMREIPVKILTKNADFVDDREMMDWIENINIVSRELVHFGFTLTGRDDMEPKASSNYYRIKTMKRLYLMGFPTFASIEPVIDWTHTQMVVTQSLDCCGHYKIGLRSGVKKDYYSLVPSGEEIRDLVTRITAAGRTVYLKESTRALLRRCFVDEECDRILSLTQDMDGNPFFAYKSKP